MTNGDKVREALSKLSDYKISLIEFCNIYDDCNDCPMNGMDKCGFVTPHASLEWLRQEDGEILDEP